MSADFSQLTEKVNEAQAQIKGTMSKGRDELRAQVEQAQAIAEQQADEMRANNAQAKEEAGTNWQAMQDKWHSHIAQLHQRATDKKAERRPRRGLGALRRQRSHRRQLAISADGLRQAVGGQDPGPGTDIRFRAHLCPAPS